MKDGLSVPCFCCLGEFRFGPSRYDGRHIPAYKISVCDACYGSNWDGWAPHVEARLMRHLEDQRLPIPPRNEKGWLPRDG